MIDNICFDEKYSTTQLLIKNKPKIINKPTDKFESVLFLPENSTRKGEGGFRTSGYFKTSYDNKPLISIITIVYNGKDYIEETIKSTINQTYENIEYIIIDGGSTDGTLEIIKKYSNKIDYWVSEKDIGIASAWNKGLTLLNGLYVIMLNADDKLSSNNILSILIKDKDLDIKSIMYGDTQFINEDGTGKILHKSSHNLNIIRKGFGFIYTSCIISKDMYKRIGLFNTKVKIAVDTEWLIRAIKEEINFKKINYVNIMRVGGVSDVQKKKAYFEYLEILQNNNILKNIKMLKLIFILRNSFFLNSKVKLQIHFILLAFSNFVIGYIPISVIKKILLKLLFRVEVGKKSYLHKGIRFFGRSKVLVGENSTINFGCYLDNRNKIIIGDNVSIAHNVKIYTLGHDINDPFFNTKGGDVIISNNVCVFSNVLIMPGVNIAEGAVIYPGSVVVKNIGKFEVWGGNPAKKLGMRNEQINYKIEYGYWFAN